MTTGRRRPLLLTGPPAVGKSTTGRALATRRPRAAFIDVDDVRQLVVAGGEAPWRGEEGAAQALLGVRNGCALARAFSAEGFDVVLADVLTPATVTAVRTQLPRCLVVHLVVDLDDARQRAGTREVWLTDDELVDLHDRDTTSPPAADVVVDVTAMDVEAQEAAVESIWAAGS